ncbi:hypothetical protein ACFPU1_06680 [Thalassorhabdus alkalitolerans]|uniref:DUF3052 domain-containing protein n=1 Tax=Thalassorhabdus alkalitolerans TaxID=2282697 RepID=A0ABW0YM01_9BACI
MTEEYDIIHLFAGWKQEVDELLPLCKDHLKGKRIVWVSYPKKASKVDTDLTRDKGWETAEKERMKGVSQVSVDDVWSAVRFTYTSEEQ